MDELASDVKAYFDTQGEKAPEPEKPAEAPAETPEAAAPAPAPEAAAPPEKPAEERRQQDPENWKKAVDEERARRKEISEQLKLEAKRREELQAKLDNFLREAEEARKPKPPAFEEDAAGHLKAKTEMSEAELRALREKVENFEKQSIQERQEGEFRNARLRGCLQACAQRAQVRADGLWRRCGHCRGAGIAVGDWPGALGAPDEQEPCGNTLQNRRSARLQGRN
jgi:hypothetical protein